MKAERSAAGNDAPLWSTAPMSVTTTFDPMLAARDTRDRVVRRRPDVDGHGQLGQVRARVGRGAVRGEVGNRGRVGHSVGRADGGPVAALVVLVDVVEIQRGNGERNAGTHRRR